MSYPLQNDALVIKQSLAVNLPRWGLFICFALAKLCVTFLLKLNAYLFCQIRCNSSGDHPFCSDFPLVLYM